MKKYIVIPGATDLNRGDQALIWESIRIAKESGLEGDYYLLESGFNAQEIERQSWQSKRKGFNFISPVLLHPGRNFDDKNTSHLYSKKQIILWGIQSLLDLLVSGSLLSLDFIKKIGSLFLNEKSKKALEFFEECEAVILKGGGLIHSYGGLTSTYQMYYSLYHILLAKSLGKKVIVMPNSFGPYKGFLVSKIVKKALSNCELVTARESISANSISNLLNKNISRYPDLGFFLKDTNSKNMKEYLLKKSVPLDEKKCVGITARPYRFPKSDDPKESYNSYINELVDFFELLETRDYHLVFVAHTLGPSKHEDDRLALESILENSNLNNITYIEDENLDCRDLKSLYGQLDYFIGTRFHSVIFSIAAGTPAIAISYGGHKGKGIMKDMKLSDYEISIDEINSSKLEFAFEKLIKEEDDVKEKMNIYIDKAFKQREVLKRKIKNNLS